MWLNGGEAFGYKIGYTHKHTLTLSFLYVYGSIQTKIIENVTNIPHNCVFSTSRCDDLRQHLARKYYDLYEEKYPNLRLES